jgi:hypothetical protein
MQKLRLAALAISLLSCLSLWGQSDRGALRGVVHDATGAVVPNASIVAINIGTNNDFKTTTSTAGEFSLPSLPASTYRVRVESTGFKSLQQDGIAVEAGETISLDLKLEIGATQETVEVTSEVAQLQTDSARVATQMSTKLVEELPIPVNGNMRSPFDLAGVTGDVQLTGSALRVGGGKAGAFGMTLDGTSITVGLSGGGNIGFVTNNTPSVEALAEFAVDSNGFKAESGHASGGSVTFVSKSGTNNLHAVAYEYLRNDKMDARGFFLPQKAELRQNDFGFTVGGPVILPKIYNGHDKTFFFFSYEGFRNRVGADATKYSVPTPEMYGGDFSNWVDANNKRYTIYDPTTQVFNASNNTYTRTAFPGNTIPSSMIDPVAKSILNYSKPLIPPNITGTPGTSAYVRNNFLGNGSNRAPVNKWNMKFDQVLTSNQRITFYYGYGLQENGFGPTGPPGLTAPLSGTPSFNRSGIYRGSHDYTVRPNLLNRLYVGVNRFTQNRGSVSLRDGAPLSEGLQTQPVGWKSKGICIPNYPDCDVAFPQISFSNEFTSWGGAATAGSDSNIIEIKDDMTWVKGSHTFKWGFFYNDTLYDGFGTQNIAGNVTSTFQSTSLAGSTSQATGGGSAFASFLLGQISGYSLDTARFIGTHFRSYAGYFQDDWRVNNRLTLNLGLRLEAGIAPVVDGDKQSELVFNLPNPAAGNIPGALIFAGTGAGRTGSRTMVPNWWGLGPRFGFSYAVDNKTVIRGSGGISYGPVVQPANASHNLGFVQRITATSTSQGITPLFYLKDGAPYWSPVPNIDPSVGNGANAPFWNGKDGITPSNEYNLAFDVQRQLTPTLSADLGYSGTVAAKLQSALLTFNALNYPNLPANLNPFTASGRTLLNSVIGTTAANSAGVKAPFAGFNALWGTGATVGQALRPFPQYLTIDTTNGGGDRIGHSTYHSMQFRMTKRYAHGFLIQGQYAFSKYLTDSDNTAGPMDPLNRSLEKALALTDQTHVLKFAYSVDLPFGKGRKLLNQSRLLDAVVGGWRLAGSNSYTSGFPIALTTTVSFPIFAGPDHPTVPTYDGWRGATSGSFDPFANNFFQPVAFFGTQPTDRFGNATRTNPKARDFAFLSENISLAKTFPLGEKMKLEFRAEAFNLLNRTQFGGLTNSQSIQNANFGKWQAQQNTPRQMQLHARFSF